MGQGKSKSISKRERNKKVTTDIPPDSQLGYKLANWNNDPSTKRKDKVKMIQYGMTEWPKREVRSDHVYWPRYGSSERWICQALNTFVNVKEPYYPKESEYAACWKGKIRNWGGKSI